ncbi:fungal-specific transcription factor domain-containing protein [Ilyonectria robusta]|uniref:fungal-specific transcription factor domain-containing protein n=1 Tax=Ilyonectria robusta TaxID=1079257 RepID=UPI001E8CA868|nr:fungal-specific transcription factor domain-containing protein [Ilyonectria robusta]KAH8721715.1 fungal-specific transcription factor domain-containing protein [Ilyonectria robusta]
MDRDQSPKNIIPRACHNCRIRKIRCSRQLPCSNCVTSRLVCRAVVKSTVAQVSPDEKPPSDKQFQSLHERLCVVEEALKTQSSQPTQATECRHYVGQTIRDDGADQQTSIPYRTTSFEGASSFGRQTLLACQVSELTSSEAGHSPSIMEEVATLRNILRNPEYPAAIRAVSTSREHRNNDITRMELPPSNFVLQVLGVLKDTQSLLFLFHAVHDRSQVEELCRRVHFPLEPLSAGELTLFNGIFLVILGDLKIQKHSSLSEEDVNRFYDICQENFQAGIETYETAMIPSYHHTLALSIALINAQIEGNLALHTSLVSVAARHCLALGYHREERMEHLPPVDAERCRRLFWRIYIFDKSLSLRLGRAPLIQDYDVDVKQWIASKETGSLPWEQIFASFVEFARIQAQVYERLYSPSSNKLDTAQRQTLIDDLSTQLSTWYSGWQQIDSTNAHCKEVFERLLEPTEVSYYSVLTILHRGATLSNSAQDIVPACFEAAQQGLRAHLTRWPRAISAGMTAMSYYGIWIFLHSSFTPFIVAFLHCIKNEDTGDLELLKNVLDTIEQISSIREPLQRQFGLCRALYRIAESFINDRLPATDQRTVLLDNTIALPLQPLFLESWDFLDPNLPLPSYLATSAAFYI